MFIDEIQDYKQPWIDIITKYFIHENTEFVVFGDEKQTIYDRNNDQKNYDRELKKTELIIKGINGPWNQTLNTVFRFSNNIGKIASQFQKTFFTEKYNIDEMLFPPQLEFEKGIIEYHTFKQHNNEKLVTLIFSILTRLQVHSSDAGVLCSNIRILRELEVIITKKTKEHVVTTFETEEQYEKIVAKIDPEKLPEKIKIILQNIRRIKKFNFWMESGILKMSTTHSFKGWEIDTLFLLIGKITESEKNEDREDELMYTALTRAKRNLIILNLQESKYDKFFKSTIQNCFEH